MSREKWVEISAILRVPSWDPGVHGKERACAKWAKIVQNSGRKVPNWPRGSLASSDWLRH